MVVLVALFAAGCQGPLPRPSRAPCPRSAFWEEGMIPRDEYTFALANLFDFDEGGSPQRGLFVFERLDTLEKYCYQTSR
jgi:hypothetical protein